jgi:hypothetical protein
MNANYQQLFASRINIVNPEQLVDEPMTAVDLQMMFVKD